MKKVLLTMLAALLALPAMTRDFTYKYKGQTLTYTVIDEDAKTCQTKAGYYNYGEPLAGNTVVGDLEIPSKVTNGNNTYSVVAFGDYGFFGCDELTSVNIPEGVTSIGDQAFSSCEGLTKAEFASIESLCKIKFKDWKSNPLWYAHHLYINGKEITDVIIPEGITSIGDRAFAGCSSLISITIPEGVTSIGSQAFSSCEGLTKAEFASIESLCKIKFSDWGSNPLCNSHHLYINGEEITDVIIPEGVTSIGDFAFIGGSMTSITIPEGVTSFGWCAFGECRNLTSVSLPEGVEYIAIDLFYGCSSLTSVSIPESVTSIGDYAFAGCSSLTSVSIPEAVTSIGDHAFSGCSSLTSVSIPEAVTSISEGTFYGCSSLTSVSIPKGVTSIGEFAFYECSSLTSVSIPEDVTSIGYYAFSGCSSLTSVSIPEAVTSIDGDAFSGCTGLTSVYYISNKLISGDRNIFSEETYEKATLYLLRDNVIGRDWSPWKNFINIKVYDPSGIEDVIADFDNDAPYDVYNLNGVKVADTLDSLAPGIYIIRQGNTVKKFAVK